MRPKPAHYAALGMSVLGHYGVLVATGIPYWRQSSWQVSSSLYGRIPTFDGIWWQCMSLKDGGFTCSNYGMPTLFVEAGIQACRGLMTIACILSFMGLLGNMLVLDCCAILGNGTKAKKLIAIISGILHLIACACALGATAFYAWQVTYEYYSPFYQEREFKYQYGPCLYIAWVSMALLVISGCILTFGSCKHDEDNFDDSYKPTSRSFHSDAWNMSRKSAKKTEYV